MDDEPAWISTSSRLPPIATPSIGNQDRLPTLSELTRVSLLEHSFQEAWTTNSSSQSIPPLSPFSPYPSPHTRSSKKYACRSVSRGQSTMTRLTPSSPIVSSSNAKTAPAAGVSKTLPIARGHDNGAGDKIEARDQQAHGMAPDGVSSLDVRSKSEPAMLSPPLSPPSPQISSTQSQHDPSENAFSYLGLSASPIAVDPCFPKSVDNYVSRLTESDVLERSRLDQVIQDIYQLCQVNVEPMSLKRVVLHNSRQRLLDQWKDDDRDASSKDDYVFLSYSRRLMLGDIDNQIRLLDVPR